MGSIMMHLCISEKIGKKYGFGNNFLIGCTLPDIYKKTTMSRSESHYLRDFVVDDGSILKLPDLPKFIDDNKTKLNDEITLGYFAHLVEDYNWFRYFSNQFAKTKY